MTDEFDAKQWSNLPTILLILAGALLIGLALEYSLRWLRVRAEAKGWRWSQIILYALRGQGLFWSLLVGIWWSLPPNWISQASLFVGLSIFTFSARIAITILIVRFFSGWLHFVLARYNLQSLSLLQKIVDGLAFLVVLTVILASLGLPVDVLLIAVAGSSVGLSLALQQPLTNLFAGVLLTLSNRFQAGDYIRLSTGEEGYMQDVDWFTTTIRQVENNLLVVPNAAMISATLINFDRPNPELLIFVDITVGRDNDTTHVEQVTRAVAGEITRQHPGAVSSYEPLIRYPYGLADYVTRLSVGLRIRRYEDQYEVIYEFFRRLQERYQQEGIRASFPFVVATKEPIQPSQSV